MFGRRFLLLVLVIVLVGGLMSAFSSHRYEAAWQQGYVMGQQAAAGAEGAAPTTPTLPYGSYGRSFGWGWGFLPFFGLAALFFKGLLFLLLLGMVGRFFCGRGWRGHRPGHGHGPWHEAWRRHHEEGHSHPPREKTPEDVMAA